MPKLSEVMEITTQSTGLKLSDVMDIPQPQITEPQKSNILDTVIKGGAFGLGVYGASKLIKPITNLSQKAGKIISSFPKAIQYKQGADFAVKIRSEFSKAHSTKVKEFGAEIDRLTQQNPNRQVSLSGVVDELRTDWNNLSNETKNIFKKTPYLKDMVKEKNPITPDINLSKSQEIINHINTKIPSNIKSNNLDVIDAVNDIRGAQLDAFPEMEQVRSSYREFIQPYKNVKSYFKFNRLLDSIKNKFGGPEGLDAVSKVLPKNVINEMGGYRTAARIIEGITKPLKILTKGFVGVAPMVLDALKFSQDPQGYIFEISTGQPKELLDDARKSLEKINRGEMLEDTEILNLSNLGLIT
jgi:hypothetical protein